ncbi:MAG TPA: M20/M25/M40 family metallo-hydrolase [Thermoanaerobaculia bacterium]|nr:M20/M25/M40 family metallo-hydrolase [Thermoanaerobaculia bacterium]
MKQALTIALLFAAVSLYAADEPDLLMQTRIRQEAFRNSKVMATAGGLLDMIGPRLTGSPNMKKANEWTRKQLEDWGLSNAHLESWGVFGRGWSYQSCSVRLVAPDVAQLEALPRAWAPGTEGPVRGKVVHARITTKEDLDKYKGKVAGKIVLLGDAEDFKPHDKAQFDRYDAKALGDLEQYQIPTPRLTREQAIKRRDLARASRKFWADEKPLAVLVPGSGDFGTIHVQSAGTAKPNEQFPVPSVVISDEQFARLVRLADKGADPEVEIDVKASWHDDDPDAYNTIAEIPGTDKKGEVVMIGAHLDSWHGGTGATDNGAGVIATMEAVRILKAIGIAPKRTIRIALWSGEEQGLLGSRGYVDHHFASRPPQSDPAERDLPSSMQRNRGPLTIKPEHAKLAGYFNLDNGTGKIRGVYLQENAAVRPIFEKWIEPLRDLGVTTLTMRTTPGTDHLSFDAAGLPAFQFIQDDVEYETRTHHTNFDTYERLQKDDLIQAAAVLATFVWEAANRPDLLPRKPLPKEEAEVPPAKPNK